MITSLLFANRDLWDTICKVIKSKLYFIAGVWLSVQDAVEVIEVIMPHDISWVVEKKVLHVQYKGTVEKEELVEVNQDLVAYLDEGEAPIHIISDQTNMDRLNADLKSFRQQMTIMNDSRWGWIMILGADPITKFFSQLVSHAFRKKMRIVKTLDDAKYALSIEDTRLVDVFREDATQQ